MAKKITSRMKLIAEIVLLQENMTLNDISKTLKISSRQVRYCISCINKYFDDLSYPILETDNKGKVIINNTNKLKIIKESKEENFKFSQKQRLDLLLIICAFNIKKMNLSQISKEINTSRMTIKNDLELAKEFLKQYHLELHYDNNFYLTGDMKNQYAFQYDILHRIEYSLYKEEFEKNEILMQQYTIEEFNNIKIRNILPIILCFLKKNNHFMADSQIYWFACTILLDIWYDKNQIFLPVQKSTCYQHHLHIDFQSFFDEIENLFEIKISKESQQHIKDNYYSICCNQTIDTQIIKFIYNLLYFIHQNYSSYFIADNLVLNNLYYHLKESYRLRKIGAEVPYTKNKNTLLDSKLESLITQFCQENVIHDTYISKQDIHYIQLCFEHLFSQKKNQLKKVLLISSASNHLKKHLCLHLESLFHLKVIKVISRYEIPFFESWENIDIILFTETIPNYFIKNIPMGLININMSFEDYFKLKQLNITPREHIMNFQELYLALNFLNKEDQIHTFQILTEYLSKYKILQSAPLTNQLHIDICHHFHEEEYEIINLNQHFKIAFKIYQKKQTQLYLNKKTNTIIFIIKLNDPAKIIHLLLNCSQLQYIELWKLNDLNQMIVFLENFLNNK